MHISDWSSDVCSSDLYSGGAYHFATLAAAELCYRRAAGCTAGDEAARMLAGGDGFMATVRRFTPDDGALAEQFDRNTGAPASAKDLAWCHAALIMTLAARRAACDRPAGEIGRAHVNSSH